MVLAPFSSEHTGWQKQQGANKRKHCFESDPDETQRQR
jgi:hypothetical protein